MSRELQCVETLLKLGDRSSRSRPAARRVPIARPAPNWLTPDAVKAIRARYRPYSRTEGSKALAREYGVTRCTIEDVAHRRTHRGLA